MPRVDVDPTLHRVGSRRKTRHDLARDAERETAVRQLPVGKEEAAAGETNPVTQQIDSYIRSSQQNPKNRPNRQVFLHFFGMEITWK